MSEEIDYYKKLDELIENTNKIQKDIFITYDVTEEESIVLPNLLEEDE